MRFFKVAIMAASLVTAVAMSGCTTSASPTLVNGRYYWAGDPACVRGAILSPTRIFCADAKGKKTGYRDAMSDQELYMYQMQVAQRRAEQAAINQQLAATNAALAAQNAARFNSLMSMPTPMVQPIAPPGGYQIRCIGVGIYTNCRY
jgi:hypothetical protein